MNATNNAITTTNKTTNAQDDQKIQKELQEIRESIEGCQKNIEQSFMEMGKLLLRAKELHGRHGKWLDWLRDNVDMSVCKAQRLMKIAERFGDEAPELHLGYSKLYILTAIPDDSYVEFVKGLYEVDGTRKTVQDMSKKELQGVVRDWLHEKKSSATPKAKRKKASAQNSVEAQIDQLKATASAIVHLIDGGGEVMGNSALCVEELKMMCTDVLEKLSTTLPKPEVFSPIRRCS